MILFTLLFFWGAPVFQGAYYGLFFKFYFSLSLWPFSRVDSFMMVQVKYRVFGFLQVLMIKIKGMQG